MSKQSMSLRPSSVTMTSMAAPLLEAGAPQRASTRRRGVVLGVVLVAGVLAGCTHYVPVLAPSLECKPAHASLLADCEAPGAVHTGQTFGDVLLLAQDDRRKLALCAQQQQDLARAFKLCGDAIATHNAELERINTSNGKAVAR